MSQRPLQRDVVCIGAAERCLFQLSRLVAQLPADFPAAVFIIFRPSAASPVCEILHRCAALPVAEATSHEEIVGGRIRVGPRDRQLRLTAKRTKLTDVASESIARPTIDGLFGSAASWLGRRVIAVLLGGGEGDGSEGARAIHSCGGLLVVPAPATALGFVTAEAASSACRPDYQVPLEGMGALLSRLTSPRGLSALPVTAT